MLGQVFLGMQGYMCLAKKHNTVTPVRLKPVAPRSKLIEKWVAFLSEYLGLIQYVVIKNT